MTTAAELLDLTQALVVQMAQDMRTGLAQLGLTPARAHLLWELHRDGPMTQRELAARLAVSPRNVTGLVDVLEQTRFVTRQRHPRDRRAILVTVTAHGDRVLSGMARDYADLSRQLFDDLSVEARESYRSTVSQLVERFALWQQSAERGSQ